MLKDSFGRIHDYLRISITDKCNLRCAYCMPHELPKGFYQHARRMNAEEIFSIAETFVDLGIRKIRITGGEPMVRKEFRNIIGLLSQLPVELTISTNGVLVHHFIDDLKQADVHSLNVSLDTLKPQTFSAITKRDEQKRVLDNILLLLQNGFEVKMNTVVIKGVNDDEIVNFVGLTQELPLSIRFIEYMPFLGNGWHRNKVISYNEILEKVGSACDFERLDDPAHSTSKNFRVKGFVGTFGVISTMSKPFCGDCNRLRLTADGKMKNCLFGRDEMDLLSALRNGEDISELIRQSVQHKYAVMGGQFKNGYKLTDSHQIVNRSMVGIGG